MDPHADTKNIPTQSSKAQTAPKYTTSSKPFPELEFLPFADEKEEGDDSGRPLFSTVLICSAVSLIVLGLLFSQRVKSTTIQNVSTNYILSGDSPTPRLIAAEVSPTTQTAIVRIPLGTKADQASIQLSPIKVGAKTPVTGVSTSTTLTPIQITTATPATSSSTPSPVATITSATQPTPYLYASTDGSSGINFSYTPAGSSTSSVVQIVNIGGSSLTVTDLSFSTTGTTNPYVLSGGGNAGCIISSSLPFELKVGATACISVHYNPTSSTTTTNSLVIRWNTSNIKSVPISVATPTPTPTNTPTPTP